MIGREKYEFVTGKPDKIILLALLRWTVDRFRSLSVVYMVRIGEYSTVSCKRIKWSPIA